MGRGRMAVMARTWTVGVDAGGTWVRARATDDRGQRRRARVRAAASEELGLTLDRIWRRWRMRGSDVARLVRVGDDVVVLTGEELRLEREVCDVHPVGRI